MTVWKRYRRTKTYTIHAFMHKESTIPFCGRKSGGLQWVTIERTKALSEEDQEEIINKLKCGHCVAILRGEFTIQGAPMRPESIPSHPASSGVL